MTTCNNNSGRMHANTTSKINLSLSFVTNTIKQKHACWIINLEAQQNKETSLELQI